MITLECNYSKKIGLPQYSSHQFSVTLKTEIADLSKVQTESAHLYSELQTAVDTSIQEVGYLPGENGNGKHQNGSPGQGNGPSNSNGKSETWNCSDKQRDLILKIVEDNRLDKNEVEKLALDRFSKSVKLLNKLEMSGLIDELLEKHGGKQNGRGRFQKAGGR